MSYKTYTTYNKQTMSTEPEVNLKLAQEHGLNEAEYARM